VSSGGGGTKACGGKSLEKGGGSGGPATVRVRREKGPWWRGGWGCTVGARAVRDRGGERGSSAEWAGLGSGAHWLFRIVCHIFRIASSSATGLSKARWQMGGYVIVNV
jgi:hypothetical protein